MVESIVGVVGANEYKLYHTMFELTITLFPIYDTKDLRECC